MGPGGIATIIASCGLLIIAIAIAYVVIRVGRFIDEAKVSLKALTDETAPLIEEVHTTVSLVNGPLKSINRITKNAEDLSDKVNETAHSFLNKNGSAVKVAGALLSVASAKKARAKKKAE
ncbi:MAG: DUF948 domain-containing protein [Actinobacteria bacterium]|jgi:uncharacterized protein YoxC|uniref:Unannotated protein n=1 Tax=freshwater metagenome TaxID=449393 RepID=A0A6J6VV88_9ZZZZ|nr:DUF948 domain-containing protein [Actinomycetota bacterium]MSY35561.1 DUF948 domain-containing protein [Actinomycetota bacterium]MTA72427.1 DUF948 domain-containing protein [Actinomycetota bacterium]MTB28961.1 DUF948 domain-containing protein [Actinomycetota bacterium]MUH48778.1 DUF948 domain-containing protein [Actinomycetota bacterium]